MNDNRTIPHETITEMVQRIEPTWEVKKATPADDGHHIVYYLDIETETERQQYILKATPPEIPPACDGEARLLAILAAHTSLPVPDVLGVVDEHEHENKDLPTPFFLSSVLPGANYNRTKLADLSAAAISRLAHSTGRHLAMLHSLDAVAAYGLVDIDADETLDGGQPRSDIEQIVVQDPIQSWTAYLTAETNRVLTGLDATRFGDLCPAVRPVLDARIDSLAGEFEPVVARIDQSLDNVLLDPESAVVGMLDWEFCVAATPTYDLTYVEDSLAGGHWRCFPGVTDRQETIRSAMLDGYREVGSSRVVEQFNEDHECYALLATLHAMYNFEHWFDHIFDATEEQRESVATALRTRITEAVDNGSG